MTASQNVRFDDPQYHANATDKALQDSAALRL